MPICPEETLPATSLAKIAEMREVIGMTLEEMKRVNPRTVDRKTLVERCSVHIDANAPREERCRQFVEQMGNPYCYLDGRTVVKISFANTSRTIEECIRGYLRGL